MNMLKMAKRRLAKHMVKILVIITLAMTLKVLIFESHPRQHSKNGLNVLHLPEVRSAYTDRSLRKQKHLKARVAPFRKDMRVFKAVYDNKPSNTSNTGGTNGIYLKQEQVQSQDKTEFPVFNSGVNLKYINFTKLSLYEKYDFMEKYNKLSEEDMKRIENQLNRRSSEIPLNISEIYKNIVSWSSIRSENNESLDPLLNLHKYSYGLNSNACKHSPDVIIFVQSTPNHFDHRRRIRQTWGSIRHFRDVSFQTVFMVGKTDLPSVQRSLQNESIINDDVIQGNFMDTYRNLTYKHIMALGWITANCPKIKLIIKVDDDTILNIFNLVKHITNIGSKHPSVYCSVYYHSFPLRNPNNKWYVSTHEYPFQVYPDYCEGFGYLMAPEAGRTLYKASEDTRFYWVDDVYATGIIALKGGVSLTNFQESHAYIRAGVRMGAESLFISATHDWHQLWSMVVDAQLSAANSTKLKM